jgi:hypothetical protein
VGVPKGGRLMNERTGEVYDLNDEKGALDALEALKNGDTVKPLDAKSYEDAIAEAMRLMEEARNGR